jgi:hypothetical protein
MSNQNEEGATARVPVKPSTQQRLKDFRNGLDVSFDEAILILLDTAMRKGENEFEAGRRLQKEIA